MINAKDLVKQVALNKGLAKSQAKVAVEIFSDVIDEIVKTMQDGEGVNIPKFGKFEVKDVEAREVRNPATGDRSIKEAHKVPKFSFSSVVKKLVY